LHCSKYPPKKRFNQLYRDIFVTILFISLEHDTAPATAAQFWYVCGIYMDKYLLNVLRIIFSRTEIHSDDDDDNDDYNDEIQFREIT
jgi:hypothetical protein